MRLRQLTSRRLLAGAGEALVVQRRHEGHGHARTCQDLFPEGATSRTRCHLRTGLMAVGLSPVTLEHEMNDMTTSRRRTWSSVQCMPSESTMD
jgi:hypothetical protein